MPILSAELQAQKNILVPVNMCYDSETVLHPVQTKYVYSTEWRHIYQV